MSEAAVDDSPPRLTEVTLAIGCLALLCLQQLHEGCLYLFGRRAPGLNHLHDAWVILLVLFVGLAAGLWHRSRAAWWLTLGVIGLLAILHLGDAFDVLRRELPPQPVAMRGRIECSVRPDEDRFGLFWMFTKSALLAAVPSLLLLAEVRRKLSRPQP